MGCCCCHLYNAIASTCPRSKAFQPAERKEGCAQALPWLQAGRAGHPGRNASITPAWKEDAGGAYLRVMVKGAGTETWKISSEVSGGATDTTWTEKGWNHG